MMKTFTQSLIVAICLLPCLSTQAQNNKVIAVGTPVFQAGTVTYGAVSGVDYTVTLTTDGASTVDGNSGLTVNWSGPVPQGVSYSFSPASPVTLTAGSASQSVDLTITSDGTTDAGDYSFTVESDNDPHISGTALFVVAQAPLTITALPQTKTYGTTVSTMGVLNTTFTVSGLLNGDAVSDATLAYSGNPSGDLAAAAAGSYGITPSAAVFSAGSAGNYVIAYNDGTLTVDPALLTITANDDTKAYGTVYPTGAGSTAFTPTGLQNSETIGSVTIASTGAPANAVVGNYPIVASAATGGTFDAANYTITYVDGSLTVTPATLTITANDDTKAYGTVYPTGAGSTAFTSTGLLAGETVGSITITSTGAPANAAVAGSPYPIVPSVATGGTFNTANYTITYVDGSLTVTPATLTITANDDTKVYGTVFPTGAGSTAFTSTGLLAGETVGSITIASTGAPANATVAGSPYPIVASVATGGTFTAANYTITYVDGALTVTPATLTITANDDTKVYGTLFPTGAGSTAFTSTGLQNSETIGSITIASTGAPANAIVAGSPYPIVPSAATGGTFTANNYTITYANGSLAVTPASLTITADDDTKVYGTVFPTGAGSTAFTSTGLQNSETIGSVTIASTGAPANAVVGNYPIVASAATGGTFDANNYTMVYVAGTLTVTKAVLTVTANNQTKVYGAVNPALTVSYSGFVGGDNAASLTTQPTATTTALTNSPVGLYPITAAGGVSSNYTFTYVAGTLTVTKAVLTVTANNQTKVYGAVNPALTVSYSGFVGGDNAASLTTQPTATTTALTNSPVGLYPITAAGGVSSNYTFTYVAGTLTVTKAVLTVTANNQTKVYGAVNPALTVSYSGFVGGDNAASLTTQPTATTTALTNSPVGLYPITAAGGVSSNYTFTYVAGTLTVTKAVLTVTANNQTKVYGAVNPALTVSYSGFVGGDNAASLTTQPTATTTALTNSPVGLYPITAAGGVSSNYTFTYVAGTLTVTKAVLTVTANNQTKVYGAVNPALTVSYSGFVGGDNAASLTTQPTATTTALTNSPVGLYPITAAGGVSSNYTFTYVAGTLTVTKAVLTVTANNQTKVYGAVNPALTVSYSGFVGGDNAASLTTQPTATTTALTNSPVGLYPITAAGGVSSNYTFTYVAGTLTVTKAVLTVTANNQTKVYGAVNPALTVSYSGFVGGDNAASLTTQPTATTTALTNSPVGLYPITAAGGVSSNYTFTYVAGTLTVTKAVLTVTANNQTKVYGAVNPALTVSYSGFVGGDNAASLTTQPTATTTALTNSPVGLYPITAAGGVSSNYTFTYVAGTLTVTKAVLTVTANNQTKVYGAVNPALTVSYSGFVGGDNAASLTTQPTATTTALTNSPVGLYPITAAGGVSSNYTFTYVAGTLTVTKAVLTVTANNQTKVYGAVNPALTVSYSGFVGGDNAASLTTQPTATTTALTNSPVGLYPITAAGGVSSNYTFTYVAGTLTVTKAVLTVTANNQTKVYGAVNPALTVSYSGFVGGDNAASLTTQPTATTTALTNSPVGLYPITAAGGVSSNYTFTYVAGTLTVTKAVLTVTANNQTKVYGAVNPALTVSYSGFVGGDNAASLTTQPTATTTALTNSPVGLYPITAAGGVSSNYTFTYVAGTLTVTKASPSIAVTSSNNPSCLGSSVTFTATVPLDATGTVQFFDGVVSLGIASVSAGSASITTSALIASSHTIKATYSGDGNYNSSTSSNLTQTVNPLPTRPAVPSNLNLAPQGGGTAIVGTFTAPSPVPTNYLVIRTTSATAPTLPVDNVNYTTGSIALGGYIVSNNTATGFTDNGLTPNTQYWYWVYSYNQVTCGGPLYSLSNLNGTATTGACTPNTLFWAGSGSDIAGTTGTDLNTPANWSTNSGSYVASTYAPNSCTNATMTFLSTGNLNQTSPTSFSNLTVAVQSFFGSTASATFSITNGIAVSGTFTCTPVCFFSIFSGSATTIFNIMGGDFACGTVLQNPTALFGTITTNYNISSDRSFITSGSFSINDQSFVTSTTTITNSGVFSTNTSSGTTSFIGGGTGNTTPICFIKNDGTINFNGNTIFGASGGGPVTLQSISSNTPAGSKVYFKGNVNFESSALTNTSNNIADYIFDGTGTQTVTVNDTTTTSSIRFSNVTVGQTNNPTVILAGSSNASLTSAATNANITVNGSSTLDLSTHTLNRTTVTGGSLNLNSTAIMKLAASTGGQTGSNFPLGFSTYLLNALSTVEYYYSGASIPIIFSTPVYGNLTLTNSSTKNAGGPLFIATNLTNNTGSTFDVVSSKNYNVTVGKDWKNNGTFVARNGIVMFHGTQNGTISGTSPTAFYLLGLNKGTDTTTTLDVSGTGLVSQTAGFPLIDTSGLLRINNGAKFSKTTTDGITINSTAGIQVNSGTFITNGSVDNSGLFRVSLGAATIGTSSGHSLTTSGISTGKFDMQGGTLTIAGRLVNTAGTASITGGTITLNTVGNASSSVGSFDMSLTTSLTINGTPVVYFQNAATGLLDLHIKNSTGTTKAITGGTFQFGNGLTPVNNIFQCYSDVPVYNVTVNNTNNPNATLSKDLTIKNILSLNSANPNGAFSLTGDTLTLYGSFNGTGKVSGSDSAGLIIGDATNSTINNAGTVNFTRNILYNKLKTLTINNYNSLTLGGSFASGDTLNIVEGDSTGGYGTVTVNGTLNTGGLLNLKSGVTGTALVAPSFGTINDTVTVERYFPALRAWRFVAIPFSSTNQTINSAWQEGWIKSSLQCSQFTGTPGYGTEITGGSAANGFDQNNTGYASIKVYQNNGWVVPATTLAPSNLVASSSNNAYCLFVRGDRFVCLDNVYPPDITTLRTRGILNQHNSGADMTVNFSGAKPNDYIFIGNPYAAPMDIEAAVALSARHSGISTDKFWLWNPTLGGLLGVGGYITFDQGLQVPFNLGDTSNYASGTVIQSGEAFMVQVSSSNAGGSGSITFRENDKSSLERTRGVFGLQASSKQNNSSFTKAAPKQHNRYIPPALYVNMLDPNNAITDGIGVGFGNKYSPYIDSIDAQKKWNEEIENIAIVKHDTTLAIDFRPATKESDTVFLRVYLRQQPYTLQIFTRGVPEELPAEAWLVDKYLGTQTQLDIYHTNLYSFTPNRDTNSYRNRFMLVFNRTGKKQQHENKGIITSTNAVTNSNLVNGGSVSIYPNPVTAGKAMLSFNNMPAGSYELIVYNAVGEKLSGSMIQHAGDNTTYPLQVRSSWNSGIYNIRIINKATGSAKNIPFIINR